MKILLAIDSSGASELVVKEAASRPWPPGTVFCVITVVDIWSLEETPSLREGAQRQAKKLVTSAADTLSQSGYEAFTEIELGVPKQAIREFASKWPADLIMIGPRGQSALARLFVGSVAQAVLRTASCSVEVVRRSPNAASHEGMRILIGTDGSEFSCKAACSVANRPWPPRSQVKVISAGEVLVPQGATAACSPYSIYSEQSLAEIAEITRKHAEDAVAETKSILRSADLKICEAPQEMPVGDPRTVLLDEASSWKADLIVVGSHGKHGFDRVLLGSVSESVATHAHCSVEVIRGNAT
jgi:nucleotide-binding universal stress UspA family protein